MTKLSVNINKVATIRNARGGNNPNVKQVAIDCQRFGAQGITVHPRPDERHIRYSDVFDIKPIITTEFNIEGYPSQQFIDMVLRAMPNQVTLVPDPPDALTSNTGWDTATHKERLKAIVAIFKKAGIRTSIFLNAEVELVKHAADTGTDRIELYTEPYAAGYANNREGAIAPFIEAAIAAQQVGLGLNAGHDLSLENLRYFAQCVPNLLEVSIGHALICDALYYGLENTVQMYRQQLEPSPAENDKKNQHFVHASTPEAEGQTAGGVGEMIRVEGNENLATFYIGKYPVTQHLWQDVMGNNPSYFKGHIYPVEQVTWSEIQEFIVRLNQRTGLQYRLPTDAEWSYAAQGGKRSLGYKYSGSDNIDDVAWHSENSAGTTHPVGHRKPNELGIYDMTGNVWEWCGDAYGTNHIMRGGSWSSNAYSCLLSNLDSASPTNSYDDLGFRLACTSMQR